MQIAEGKANSNWNSRSVAGLYPQATSSESDYPYQLPVTHSQKCEWQIDTSPGVGWSEYFVCSKTVVTVGTVVKLMWKMPDKKLLVVCSAQSCTSLHWFIIRKIMWSLWACGVTCPLTHCDYACQWFIQASPPPSLPKHTHKPAHTDYYSLPLAQVQPSINVGFNTGQTGLTRSCSVLMMLLTL